MDQPENKPEHSGADAAREAAGKLREEAAKTLNDLRSPGGVMGFFKFDRLYFPDFARILFTIICLFLVVVFLFGVVASFISMASVGFFSGLINLVVIFVSTIVMVVMARVWIEVVLVAFKINESVQDIKEILKQKWQ